MADAGIVAQIRTFLTPMFSNKSFTLRFTYNDVMYTTSFKASHAGDTITIDQGCVTMTLEPAGFVGQIQANSTEKGCFSPTLVSDPRTKVGKRTTSADVLQILKTKLGLAFPTDTEITIYDGARIVETLEDGSPTMISPFHLLRGGPAFYEKYGYASPIINDLKVKLETFTWSECTEDAKSVILDCRPETHLDGELLTDIMKKLSWEDEVAFNNRQERSLSYRVFRQFALKRGVPLENSNQFAPSPVWKFSLDKESPKWIQCDKDLQYVSFMDTTNSSHSTRRRKKRARSRRRR
jgi:hypothetical protein